MMENVIFTSLVKCQLANKENKTKQSVLVEVRKLRVEFSFKYIVYNSLLHIITMEIMAYVFISRAPPETVFFESCLCNMIVIINYKL